MRKYLQLVLLWAVVLVLAGSAGAEYYNEGHSGTAADPYVIDTNADLVMLRDRVNAGTESADKYYQLTQNLTISQYTNWKFIGTDTNPFTGHFDGNNLAIHVNITRGPYWSSEEDLQAGLFGTVSTNEGYAVRNLDVSGTITGMYTGGIVRRLNSGIVENCSFSGTIEDFQVSGNAYLGGIAGYMAGGTIRDCSFSGEITSTSYTDTTETGCIAAHMTGGSIENCTATGNVSVSSRETSTYAGGIVGYAQVARFEAIKDCTFSGNVKCSRYAGGIAGYISGGSLQNNSITGNANGQAVITGNYASGGIAGRIGDSTVLESCDVSSIVIVSGDTESEGIGGIVGIMNASTVRNNQSYASIGGDVPNMGGVVGKLDAASYTITNNRYSSAEHGIGNNAQGVPSEEGCIKVGASIAITTGSLPNAAANSSYTAVLTTNSTSSVVWTLTNSTSLPTGLTLDRTTGTISGTPKTAGTYTFTIKASPVSGAPATKEFTLTVQAEGSAPSTPAPTTSILITTTSLPSGLVGTPYSETLKASASGVTWSVYAGSLPNGLTLVNSSGRISGTPTSSGTFDFTIQARSTYASTTKSFRITIYQGSNSNNSSSGSSSGGGCTSGFGILGLILLAGMAFKKSQMKRSLYIVILLMFFSLPAHALIGKPDYVDPNKVNPYDFYVICKKGFAQKISEAVAKGADVNAKVFVNKYEQDATPLMAAARENSVDAVKLLIKSGADVNAKRKDGISALGLAAAFNTPDVVEALLKAGAKNKEAPLVRFSNLPARNIAVLLKYGADPNVRLGGPNGFTALMSILDAANSSNERNTIEAAKMLINAGSDINAKANGGYTALWIAARRSLVEMVRLLIKKGTDVNASAESVTILETSATYSTPETVKILIASGADVNLVYNVYNKKRAVDYARKRKVLQGTSALKRLEAASR